MGVLFLGFSWATRERMGYGDSWAILILGIFLGLWGLLEVLAAAFFFLCGQFLSSFLPERKCPGGLAVPFLSVFDSRVSDQCLWRRLSVRKKGLEASFTVEMSAVAPLCLLLVAACILVFFYFHDKNILSGAAYETATTGSIKAREKDGVEPGELEALFAQRTGGKCILFAGAGAEVSVTEEEVAVNVTASAAGCVCLFAGRRR